MNLSSVLILLCLTVGNIFTESSYKLAQSGGESAEHFLEAAKPKQRSFTIDHSGDSFLKDGLPFRYISGTIHYFRVHHLDWRDRIQKLKHAGCNVLQTYIEWGSHEPEPGVFDFSGTFNITDYLSIAHEEGLQVILRPGPYICAERDMGGLPYWLLRMNPLMELRTNDPTYLTYVDQWFGVLFPKLVPFLYQNGGPIIMVQIENEYGSYASCDFAYTSHLRDVTIAHLGTDVQLFTTDGDWTNYLRCGKIPHVYATIDFGPESDAGESFVSQRLFEPTGPLVNSEYYPGWIDHWGEPHSTRDSELVATKLDEMLAMNASVNIYVFNGGTNFGLRSGANFGDRYQPCPTSYDFDSPLTEAGDPTEKYYAIRNITQKYTTLPPGPIPGASSKFAYGDTSMFPIGNVFSLAPSLPSVTAKWPLNFEDLGLFNGLVIYETTIPKRINDPSRLSLFELHDRGYVFVDLEFAGVVSRQRDIYEVPIYGRINQTLSIVVESQGRIGYGPKLKDFKGILTNVTLDDTMLEGWKMTLVDLSNLGSKHPTIREALDHSIQRSLGVFTPLASPLAEMTYYKGSFEIPNTSSHPMDTFLRLDGWTKGYAYVNDFLLGRYWPEVGPQVTLYIPHGLLNIGTNSIMLLELEKSPCGKSTTMECKVTLVDQPEVDGPTPQTQSLRLSSKRLK